MASNWDIKQLVAGLIFATIGTVAVFMSLQLDVGTPIRVGPGGFPLLLGTILTVLGFVHIVMGVLSKRRITLGNWRERSIYLIPLSVLVFGLTVDRVGLPIATAVTSLVAMLSNRKFRWLETLVITFILTLFSVVLFIYGLDLPLPLLPRGF